MNYPAKIEEIESELAELKVTVKSATGDDKHYINQRIIALENTRTELYKHLPLPVATAGNSHSI
jgi:hypothetical protein